MQFPRSPAPSAVEDLESMLNAEMRKLARAGGDEPRTTYWEDVRKILTAPPVYSMVEECHRVIFRGAERACDRILRSAAEAHHAMEILFGDQEWKAGKAADIWGETMETRLQEAEKKCYQALRDLGVWIEGRKAA